MAKKVKDESSQYGYLNYKDLQTLNDINMLTGKDPVEFTEESLDQYVASQGKLNLGQAIKLTNERALNSDDQYVQSPLYQEDAQGNRANWLGYSIYDPEYVEGSANITNLWDNRGESQGAATKLLNGTLKGVGKAATTFLEGLATITYGLGKGIYEAATLDPDDENEREKSRWNAFAHALWDNEITRPLQAVDEALEKALPNYYTEDELENPFDNIFTANFLGDKLIKNMGFMVGAFYGGLPLASAVGKAGSLLAKGVRATEAAKLGAAGERFLALTEGKAPSLIKEAVAAGKATRGLTGEALATASGNFSEEALGLSQEFAAAGLTDMAKGKIILDGLDRINKIAGVTRANSQLIGSLGSAINEGSIEAITNSKQWALPKIQEENLRHEAKLEEIEERSKDNPNSPGAIQAKLFEEEYHQKQLADLEYARARMGNMDLMLNVPILTLQNLFQVGRLYLRGFNSSRRNFNFWWNPNKDRGELGNLKTLVPSYAGVVKGFANAAVEGAEEMEQSIASKASGYMVDQMLERYEKTGLSEDSQYEMDDFILGMSKSMAESAQDPKAWDEFFVGFLSSLIGMPAFGSQAAHADVHAGPIGIQGGLIGEYKHYKNLQKDEKALVDYLNDRIKSGKAQKMYESLRKSADYEALLQQAAATNDKEGFKDIQAEALFADINAAAALGKLDAFKSFVGYNTEYTDEELESIINTTTEVVDAQQQYQEDVQRSKNLQTAIEEVEAEKKKAEGETKQSKEGKTLQDVRDAQAQEENSIYTKRIKSLKKDKEALDKKIKAHEDSQKNGTESPYREKAFGPFRDREGRAMNTTEEGKKAMREILERNKNNLLEGIDQYLKLRNDIDIESNGRLSDKELNTLTLMRYKIFDWDKRTMGMAEEVGKYIGQVLEGRESKEDIQKYKEKISKATNAAKTVHEILQKGKVGSNDLATLEQLESEEIENKDVQSLIKEAKEVVEIAVAQNADLSYLPSKALQKRAKDTSEAWAKKNKETEKQVQYLLDRMSLVEQLTELQKRESQYKYNSEEALGLPKGKRYANAEEVQNMLSSKGNVLALLELLATADNMDEEQVSKLQDAVLSLHSLAIKKQAYNHKLREFLKDPSLIQEASRRIQDNLSREDTQKGIKAAVSNFQSAKDRQDLDIKYREAVNLIGRTAAKEALKQAKTGASENIKEFIEDYERGLAAYEELLEAVQKIDAKKLHIENNPDAANFLAAVENAAISTVSTSWIDALRSSEENLKEAFSNKVQDYMAVMQNNPETTVEGMEIIKTAVAAIQDIIKDLNWTTSASSTNGKRKVVTSPTTPDSSTQGSRVIDGSQDFGEIIKIKKEIENAGTLDALQELETKYDKIKTNSALREAYNKKLAALKSSAQTEQSLKSIESLFSYIHDKIDAGEALSDKDLSDIVNRYNNEHPDDKIALSSLTAEIAQYKANKELESLNEGYDPTEEAKVDPEEIHTGEGVEDTKSKTMQRQSKEGYNSTPITRYILGTEYQKENEGKDIINGEKNENVEPLIEFLNEWQAFDFVDHNYLGVLYHRALLEGKPLPIHFVKSTDSRIQGKEGLKNTVFLAIELTNADINVLQKLGYKNAIKTTPAVIGNKTVNLQIVGVLGVNTKAPEEIKNACDNLRNAVNNTIGENALKEAEKDGRKFVVYDKATSKVEQVFTGRIAAQEYNAGNPKVVTQSLTDFTNGIEEAESAKLIAQNFYFGVVNAQGGIVTQEAEDVPLHDLKTKKLTNSKGKVLLYVRRPDGIFYPLSLVKNTVKSWWEANGSNFETILKEASKTKNTYFGRIVADLKILLSEDSSEKGIEDKVKAARDFMGLIYARQSTPLVQINSIDGTVSFKSDNSTSIGIEGDTIEEKIESVFKGLAETTAFFTLPQGEKSLSAITAQSIINSGAFSVRMASFYNYNANFIIQAVDSEGTPVYTASPVVVGDPLIGQTNGSIITANLQLTSYNDTHKYYIENGKVFYLEEDGTHSQEVSNDIEREAILALKEIEDQGRNSKHSLKEKCFPKVPNEVFDDMIKSTDDLLKSAAYWITENYLIDINGELFLVDTSKARGTEIIRITSTEASDKISAYQTIINEKLQSFKPKSADPSTGSLATGDKSGSSENKPGGKKESSIDSSKKKGGLSGLSQQEARKDSREIVQKVANSQLFSVYKKYDALYDITEHEQEVNEALDAFKALKDNKAKQAFRSQLENKLKGCK